MTISDASWSANFRLIGDLERPNHYYLTENDQCLFWGEYTARAGYGHSTTNQIIANLKKGSSLRHTAQWQHKVQAMDSVARIMKAAINPEALPRLTFVPIPPSKLKTDPEYDDRMVRIARQISPQGTREMIHAIIGRETRHNSDNRRDPGELRATLQIDETQCALPPTHVFLLDDVITTGCSFMVCKQMLTDRFPGISVTGMFVARRALAQIPDMFNGLS
jgi:hypothetical protein